MRFSIRRWVITGVLLLAGFGAVSDATAQAAPEVPGLWDEASVYRDEYGTPHVQASSLRGMAFGFGYAQAEDHLETMLMAYRLALGRAAAVGGEAFADSDAFAIRIANAETTRNAMSSIDGETLALCEGFALGVNSWIFAHQDEVPDWVEGVQPMDVLAYWHYLMVTSAPLDLPTAYQPERPFKQANAWALAPQKTLDGKTLLVMNPHQHYRAPFQWYEAHLMLGPMNWAGATLIGVPVLLMGHNDHLGWALTPNEADIADVFREDMSSPARAANDPTLPSVMEDMAPILSFMSTAKTYYVRTANGLEERSAPSFVGGRGPMLEGGDGGLYSWRNGAYGQFGGMAQLLRMAQSTNLAAFQDAMLLHQLPCFQVLYADGAGNLFYLYNARLGNKNAALAPDDATPVDWTRPVDAKRDSFAWRDLVGLENLPHIVNPESGFLQACGTPPWLATVNSGLRAGDWPQWLVPEDENYRAVRVRQILSAGSYHLYHMEGMLFDTLVPAAVDMVPLILKMAQAQPRRVQAAHPDLVTGLALLKNWNLSADANSEALLFYERWWTLMKARHQADFANEAALYRGLLQNTPAAQESVLAALEDAARGLRNDFNRLAIPWGEMHRINRGGRDEAMFGSDVGDSIFVARGRLTGGRRQVDFGYGFAMAVEFGETPRALSIVPFGASEKPASPHYRDQMDRYLQGRMKDTHFSYADVARHARSGFGRRVVLGVPELTGTCAFRVASPQSIALETVNYPPRPYPTGQVPFTPTVRPQVGAGSDGMSWELEWYVPESVCRSESQSRLRFYTYTRDGGWEVLLSQRFDDTRRAFVGSGSGPVMMAIMGPEVLREKPADDETPILTAEAERPEEGKTGAFEANPAEVVVNPTPVPEEGDVVPGDEAMVETAAPAAPAPQQRLFDLEVVGGPAAAGGENGEVEKKKGFFKRLRGKKKDENLPETNDVPVAE